MALELPSARPFTLSDVDVSGIEAENTQSTRRAVDLREVSAVNLKPPILEQFCIICD